MLTVEHAMFHPAYQTLQILQTRNTERIFPFQLKTVPLSPNYLHPLSGFEKTRTESK